MDRPTQRFSRQFGGPLLVTALVQILGVCALVATALGVLWRLWVNVSAGHPVSADFALGLVGILVLGATGGGLLLGLAALLRYLEGLIRSLQSLDRERRHLGEGAFDEMQAAGDSSAPGATPTRILLADMLAALEEMRDISLLPESDRQEVSQRMVAQQQQRLNIQIRAAIEDHRLRGARQLLDHGIARFGATPDLDLLSKDIDALDASTEPLDYARALAKAEEFIRTGEWGAAERITKAQATGHPQSQRSRQLCETTSRGRRYALIQEYTTKRSWTEALAAAEEFVATYPNTLETKGLNSQLGTLRSNAEIQRRKQYETLIHDHIKKRRFGDAIRLARTVIDNFPSSPQAQALKKQIPLLERKVGQGVLSAE